MQESKCEWLYELSRGLVHKYWSVKVLAAASARVVCAPCVETRANAGATWVEKHAKLHPCAYISRPCALADRSSICPQDGTPGAVPAWGATSVHCAAAVELEFLFRFLDHPFLPMPTLRRPFLGSVHGE